MRKYDFISALAKETAAEVVKNREEWMKYLTTAARLYKYPFREQLLIYAQRPDATACASIELWNERMHCWVNKGAKGIALLDEDEAHGKRLKYVFDVSDVHAARRIGRYPELWELHEEHKEDVIKRLEQTYGATDDKKLFEERLMEIAERIAVDYYEELLPDLQYMIEGSFLEGLDEQNYNMIDDRLNNGVEKFNREEEKKEQAEKPQARTSLKERLAAKQTEVAQGKKDSKEQNKAKKTNREEI